MRSDCRAYHLADHVNRLLASASTWQKKALVSLQTMKNTPRRTTMKQLKAMLEGAEPAVNLPEETELRNIYTFWSEWEAKVRQSSSQRCAYACR